MDNKSIDIGGQLSYVVLPKTVTKTLLMVLRCRGYKVMEILIRSNAERVVLLPFLNGTHNLIGQFVGRRKERVVPPVFCNHLECRRDVQLKNMARILCRKPATGACGIDVIRPVIDGSSPIV